ncbi:hypothetical protein AABB24_014051 [Solanum stoloniferum]|uniref:Uncharacterized protein n=1 Tax=Solanum stoloniferum TaxID=62892 RepID=A0ABD2TWW4_9SOLN|nr:LOW QUALITY PROTEIN: uncharacterized protein LOC125828038 [Solanum verrucosum]XP_049415478.1 uncharacterized protein LOC125878295 [Solanum stenotomum]
MAGVALLQPQDVLKHHVSYRQPMRSRRNSTSNPLPNPNPNPNPKNNRRKRSPQKNGSANFSTCPPSAKNLHLVMGEVKILKRGQVLKENKLVTGEDLVLSTTDRLGPEPDMVPKNITIAHFYAGSGFSSSSPPPSSLPVPAFFKKESEHNLHATSDLRRLLRIDLAD